MTLYEKLMAERFQPTRFGESILADRATTDVEEMLHEAEVFLANQNL